MLECFEDMKTRLEVNRVWMRSKTLLRVMSSPSNAKRLRFSPKNKKSYLQKAHSQDSGLDHKNFKILSTSSERAVRNIISLFCSHFELSFVTRKTIKGDDIKGHDDDHEVIKVHSSCTTSKHNTQHTQTPTDTCSR